MEAEMIKLPHHAEDELLVKRRFDSHFYKIKMTDYNRIMELVDRYDDAIYYLPDFETVEVVGVDDDVKGMRVVVPVRTLLFC